MDGGRAGVAALICARVRDAAVQECSGGGNNGRGPREGRSEAFGGFRRAEGKSLTAYAVFRAVLFYHTSLPAAMKLFACCFSAMPFMRCRNNVCLYPPGRVRTALAAWAYRYGWKILIQRVPNHTFPLRYRY